MGCKNFDKENPSKIQQQNLFTRETTPKVGARAPTRGNSPKMDRAL